MENDKSKRERLTILTSSASALLLIVFFAVALLPGIQERGALTAMSADSSAVMQETQAENEDPLESFRIERTQMRDIEIKQLNEIIGAENTSDEIHLTAARQLMALLDYIEKETTIEGVLRARGYEDALATVRADSVNILLRTAEIKKEDSAVILSLVMQETGVSGGNIKIIPVE